MHQPDQRFCPTDMQGRAGWFQNYSDQMQIIGASLLFTTGELDRIKDDNTMVQFMASSMVTVDAFDLAVRNYRRDILGESIGVPTPVWPTFSGLVLPSFSSPVETGIWQRLNQDVGRIRKAPAYTTEVGGLLGIIPSSPDLPSPGDVTPEIQVSAAANGYMFGILVSKREEADQWQVWIARVGTTDWSNVATATGKSADVTVTPTGEETGPIQLQVRVQLRRDNANYGQPSQIALVTVNP